MQHLPNYKTRLECQNVRAEFKFAAGAGFCPPWLLRSTMSRISHVRRKLCAKDQAMHNRIVCLAFSDGDPDLYPDLWAAMSGAKEKFDIFFKFAADYCDEISGSSPYHHGNQHVLDTSQT
eukprot:10494741-Ditylum_brightwellii.AAC.1